MKELWQPQSTAVGPSEFLSALWRLVPTFRGYQQQVRFRPAPAASAGGSRCSRGGGASRRAFAHFRTHKS